MKRIYLIGDNMFTFIKGFIIGLGKIIPGVSGSLLAISLNVYEKCIDIISNIFKELKYNIKFLFLLCLGILLGIVFGSKIIYYFLTNYHVLTMCLFVGLIGGTIPNILNKVKIERRTDYFYIIIPFLLIYFLGFIQNGSITIENNFNGYLLVILLGFLDALTMIVPGVSGTAIFMIIGVYEFILLLFSNFFSIFIVFFLIGLVIGIILVSKFMNYCFKNFYKQIYLIIIGLTISSLVLLLKNTFIVEFSVLEFLFGVLLICFGIVASIFFDNK